MNKTLYKITSSGKIQEWKSWIEDGDIVVSEYGQQGGKKVLSRYQTQPTNVGRSNQRDSSQQAVFELKASYVAQVSNKHYRESVEEAIARDDILIPMKLQNAKDHMSKITYPCYVSNKFNGSRRTYYKDQFLSKIGRPEDNKLEEVGKQLSLLGVDVDGEVYCHGMSLQRIRSASLKPKEDTEKLGLVIFDIPDTTLTFEHRLGILENIQEEFTNHPDAYSKLSVEIPVKVYSEEELLAFLEEAITNKYEGIVIRMERSMFESGKRSYGTMKLKPRYDAEAYCYKVEICKNGTGKLLLRTHEGIEFKAMMKVKRRDGNEYPRDFASMEKECINQWITYSFEELSDIGVPTKPVAECLRKCDGNGVPVE